MQRRDLAKRSFTPRRRMRRTIGWIGIVLAAPFFIWLPAGFIPGVPNIIEVFGIAGLRTPAAVTITGLLLAAFGFHEA
jgi:hypothetical protein